MIIEKLNIPLEKQCLLSCLFMVIMFTGAVRKVPKTSSGRILRLSLGSCSPNSLICCQILLTPCCRQCTLSCCSAHCQTFTISGPECVWSKSCFVRLTSSVVPSHTAHWQLITSLYNDEDMSCRSAPSWGVKIEASFMTPNGADFSWHRRQVYEVQFLVCQADLFWVSQSCCSSAAVNSSIASAHYCTYCAKQLRGASWQMCCAHGVAMIDWLIAWLTAWLTDG